MAKYDISRQIRSYNLLVLNLYEFFDMWRDVLAPGPLSQRLKHFWMPTEWKRIGHTPIQTWTVERMNTGVKSESRTKSFSPQPQTAFSNS